MVIPIEIDLDISFIRHQIDPEITIMLDHTVVLEGPQTSKHRQISISRTLDHGPHVLEIHYHNMHKERSDDADMAVVINHVRFQHIDHDFKIYSRYRPVYPSAWLQQQQCFGATCSDEIHSNYLGWNGVWYLAFQVPIYRWAHNKMNLGWLI